MTDAELYVTVIAATDPLVSGGGPIAITDQESPTGLPVEMAASRSAAGEVDGGEPLVDACPAVGQKGLPVRSPAVTRRLLALAIAVPNFATLLKPTL